MKGICLFQIRRAARIPAPNEPQPPPHLLPVSAEKRMPQLTGTEGKAVHHQRKWNGVLLSRCRSSSFFFLDAFLVMSTHTRSVSDAVN